MSIFVSRDTPLSPEIQKLHEETKELKLRAYKQKLEQKNKKLLKEINKNNTNNNEEERETKNDERAAENKLIYKYILAAILSYTLLMFFMFSTFYIIYSLRMAGCREGLNDFDSEDVENALALYGFNKTEIANIVTSYDTKYKECLYVLSSQFSKNSAIITLHNLTFGLISAVVVSQIGCYHQQQQQSQQKDRVLLNLLTNQLFHSTEFTSGSQFMLKVVYYFITWCPRMYILLWIPTGGACLICGALWGAEEAGPLYITGQAWLGIAITTVYLFFGLQETSTENSDTKKETDSVVDGHNDNDNDDDEDSGGVGFDANCCKHNDKNEEFELDQMIGKSSSMAGEKNNTVTSSALIQTATSRCRFVEEEKNDEDEEGGTLYLTGTKSNDKRNDACDDNSYFTQVKSLFTHTHQPSIS